MIKELDIGWQLIKGKNSIIFVASHNFSHFRDENLKPADLGTGDIARDFAKKFNCYGLVSTKIQDDPNWYETSDFRIFLKDLITEKNIKLVIDIHGSLLINSKLIKIYPNNKFKSKYSVNIDDIAKGNFVANDQLTIVEELEDRGVAAVEIEIREDGRVDTIDPGNYNKAQEILHKLFEKIID